jgi:hypothetical protein
MQITQPTQIIQPINLQLSAEDHSQMTGTIPTLILSHTPSPIIKRSIPEYHHVKEKNEENPLLEDVAESVISPVQEAASKLDLLKGAPTDSQSFQFHTPIVNEVSVARK